MLLPNSRLSLNLGVRADFVKRSDEIFDVARHSSTEFAPRLGFSYLVTKDSRNVLCGSYGGVHERPANPSRSEGQVRAPASRRWG